MSKKALAAAYLLGIMVAVLGMSAIEPVKTEWAERAVNAAILDKRVRSTNKWSGEIEYIFNPDKERHRWIQLGLREDGVVVWREKP